MALNLSVLCSNIKELSKRKGIKLGEIEEIAGVSPGYFSRLAGKDDSKSTSSLLDALSRISDKTGVSIDSLLTVNFSALTPTEVLVEEFIERLTSETCRGSIGWRCDDAAEVEMLCAGGDLLHPLIRDPENKFVSWFHNNSILTGNIYSSDIRKNKTVYLVKTKLPKGDIGYELYLWDSNTSCVNPLCAGYSSSNETFLDILIHLYEAAAESINHVVLDKDVSAILQQYVDGIEPDSDDNVPF